jgi:hypothetical protein
MRMIGYNAGIERLRMRSGRKKEVDGVKKIMKDLEII